MAFIGADVRIYGRVAVGECVIIEQGVTIGHPAIQEIRQALLSGGSRVERLEELYSSASAKETVIGNRVIVRSGTVIYDDVVIEEDVDIGHNVIIREGTRIGRGSYIKNNAELCKGVRIGKNCRVAGVVADFSVVADRASVFGYLTHRYDRPYEPAMSKDVGPRVMERAIVGRGAVVVGNVEVGADAVVGAATFVNFDVPAGALVVGTKGALGRRRNSRGCPHLKETAAAADGRTTS